MGHLSAILYSGPDAIGLVIHHQCSLKLLLLSLQPVGWDSLILQHLCRRTSCTDQCTSAAWSSPCSMTSISALPQHAHCHVIPGVYFSSHQSSALFLVSGATTELSLLHVLLWSNASYPDTHQIKLAYRQHCLASLLITFQHSVSIKYGLEKQSEH